MGGAYVAQDPAGATVGRQKYRLDLHTFRYWAAWRSTILVRVSLRIGIFRRGRLGGQVANAVTDEARRMSSALLIEVPHPVAVSA